MQDYGEDLLVQPSHAGQMDATRLWVQVKGTEAIDNHARQDGGFSYSVSVDHAIRWARSADPVIVVLWDVEAERGYYTWPMFQVDAWELPGTKTTTLRFRQEDVLTADAVVQIAWNARTEHYNTLIAGVREVARVAEGAGEDPRPAQGRARMIGVDFLCLLGLVERIGGAEVRYQVRDEAKKVYAEEFVELHGDGPYSIQDALEAAITTVFRYANMASPGLGLHHSLLESAADALAALLSLDELIEKL